MYINIEGETIVRVPPSNLGADFAKAVLDVTKESLEGRLVDIGDNPYNPKKCFVVSVTKIKMMGDGSIVHGDGGVYQTVKYELLFCWSFCFLLKLRIAAFSAGKPVLVFSKKYAGTALRAESSCPLDLVVFHFVKFSLQHQLATSSFCLSPFLSNS